MWRDSTYQCVADPVSVVAPDFFGGGSGCGSGRWFHLNKAVIKDKTPAWKLWRAVKPNPQSSSVKQARHEFRQPIVSALFVSFSQSPYCELELLRSFESVLSGHGRLIHAQNMFTLGFICPVSLNKTNKLQFTIATKVYDI